MGRNSSRENELWRVANNDDLPSSTAIYFKTLNTCRFLSRQEELEFARVMKDPDKTQSERDYAKGRLIESCLRLVVMMAMKLSHVEQKLPLNDLIQEGNFGLVRAVQKFNPDLGYRLTTYSVFWIKQAMNRAINNEGEIIRIPVHKGEARSIIKRAIARLGKEFEREPTVEEIARHTNIPLKDVIEIFALGSEVVSLDEHMSNETDAETTFADQLIDPNSICPEEATLEQQYHLAMMNDIRALCSAREVFILGHRYGLYDGQPRTLEEIAVLLAQKEPTHLSRERIRQIEQNALRKIRKNINPDLNPSKNGHKKFTLSET